MITLAIILMRFKIKKNKNRPSHEWRAIARAHTRHKFDKACDHRTPWF